MAAPSPVPPSSTPGWMTLVLKLAGIYNLAWGAWVVLTPGWSSAMCGYPVPPHSQELWQCLGMVVGVYGIGYWIAGSDPVRHWPIVLVGLLGKVLGPIGFVIAYFKGTLPLQSGLLNIFNDLIWWIPFTLILWHTWRVEQLQRSGGESPVTLNDGMSTVLSSQGKTLAEHSAERPMLVVFLRHTGCTFCREALADVQLQRAKIEAEGTGIALVHMSPDDQAAALFRHYGLDDVPRFSDPEQTLYRAFDLKQGRFSQLLGPAVLLRGMKAAIFGGHGIGKMVGNALRMPGTFLVRNGHIVRSFRNRTAAERPDYAELACGLPAVTASR